MAARCVNIPTKSIYVYMRGSVGLYVCTQVISDGMRDEITTENYRNNKYDDSYVVY